MYITHATSCCVPACIYTAALCVTRFLGLTQGFVCEGDTETRPLVYEDNPR